MAKREYRGKVPIDQVSNHQLIASGREKELIVSKERALQLAQFKALKREANQLKRRLNQPQRQIIKDHVKNGGLRQPPENLQRYASERGVMMPELAVKLMLLLILISLLLPTLVACTNTVGTEQPVDPTPITEVVEIEPTEAAPELPEGPAFAPTAEAESPETEEENLPPEIEEVNPWQEYVDALTAIGTPVAVTPENFLDVFQAVETPSGIVYVRADLENSKVTILGKMASDGQVHAVTVDGKSYDVDKATGAINIYATATPEGEPTETIDPVTLTPTPTVPEDGIPTPPAEEEETPSPEEGTEEPPVVEVDPSENIELVQTVVGPEFTITSIGLEEYQLVVDKTNNNPETVSYRVAYDNNGIIQARWSNENGGNYEWIAGGPFSPDQLNNGQSYFPGVKNGLNFLGVQVTISQRFDFDGNTGHEPLMIYDSNGNPTDFRCESGVIGHHLNAQKLEERAFYPVIIVNVVTGQRISMQLFHDIPLPEYTLNDFSNSIARRYYQTHEVSGLYDNPQEVNYTFEPNAVKPTYGFGDVINMPFYFPGATPSGNNEFINGATFISPVASTFSSLPGYESFVNSGSFSEFEGIPEFKGLPVWVPNTTITWDEDNYR